MPSCAWIGTAELGGASCSSPGPLRVPVWRGQLIGGRLFTLAAGRVQDDGPLFCGECTSAPHAVLIHPAGRGGQNGGEVVPALEVCGGSIQAEVHCREV